MVVEKVRGRSFVVVAGLLSLPLVFFACGDGGGDGAVPPAGDAAVASDAPASSAQDAARIDTRGADAAPTALDAADAAPLDPLERPGIFAAVGNHVRHVRSLDDGQTWIDDATDFDTSLTGDLYGIRTVVWGHDEFIAFAAKVLTSPDGKTWTEVPKPDGQWMASMLYAQGEYVSSGGYGWLATTTSDLGSWDQHPPMANYTTAHHSRQALAHGVVNGSDAYVVVDDEGNVFHAADGKTWLATTGAPVVPAGNTWGTLFAFGGGVFVGVLPSGTDTIRSTDGGATWSANAPLAAAVEGLIYAQGHFTATAPGHVFTSLDGATWTDHSEATAVGGDLTYGHGTYLALRGGDIFRSTDGLTWAKVFDHGGNVDEIHSIAFGPR